MNDSESIFRAIQTIAESPKKTEKEALIVQGAASDTFVKVLEYAYNPFRTFGIATVPEKQVFLGNEGVKRFDADTWALLDALAARALTGNAAREAVQREVNALFSSSAELLRRIIAKDLRAGFSESTINKAIKGLLPEFPYMRCALPSEVKLDQYPWERGVFSQEKVDALYVNLNHEGSGVVQITSRQGTPFVVEPFAALHEETRARLSPATQTQGELVVRVNGEFLPRQKSNGIINSVNKGGAFEPGQELVLLVWDQIPLEAVVPKGQYSVPYEERLESLAHQLAATKGDILRLVPGKRVYSLEEANEHYRVLLAEGKEGIVLKHPDGIWRDTGSSGSKHQVKFKLKVEVDLMVVDFLPGNGKNAKTFGSILCRTSDELLEVAVSGISDKLRREINAQRESLRGTVMTVKANALMRPSKPGGLYSLFLPRFVEFRTDKMVADTLAQVEAQFESAMKAA